MTGNRNIYAAPEGRTTPDVAPGDVDLTPREIRRRAWRRTIWSVVFMSLLLLGAVRLFDVHQQHAERAELDDLAEEGWSAPVVDRSLAEREPVERLPAPLPLERLDEAVAVESGLSPGRAADAMAHLRTARMYLADQQWEAGEQSVREALAIWPGMPQALRMLGFVLTQQGRFDQALRVLTAARQADPGHPEVYNTLAAVLIQQGEFDLAEEMLFTSLRIQPDYVQAQLNLGMLYLAAGRYERAVDAFSDVLESRPEQMAIRNNLAVSLLRIGRIEAAREQLRRLIADHPEVPAWYYNMAITYIEEQKPKVALEWVKAAAGRSSPMEFRQYMLDDDFDEFRGWPPFMEFKEEAFPDLPVL